MRNWQVVIKDTDGTATVRIKDKSTSEAVAIYRELKKKYKGIISLKGYGENIELSSKGRN
jgi:hypothetical protein